MRALQGKRSSRKPLLRDLSGCWAKEPANWRDLREKTEVATHGCKLRIGTPKGPRVPGGAQHRAITAQQNGEDLAGAVLWPSRPGKRLRQTTGGRP